MKTVQKLLPSRFRRSAKLATQSARTNQDSSQGNLQHPSAEPRSRSVCEPDRACPPVEANETSEERELQDTHDPDSANDTREARGQRCHNEQGNRYGDIYIYGTHARAVLGNVIGNLENAQAPHPDDDLKCALATAIPNAGMTDVTSGPEGTVLRVHEQQKECHHFC